MRTHPKIDLIGRTFSRWTVLSFDRNSSYPYWRWNCVCQCGAKRSVNSTHLRYGMSMSCGCLNRESVTKHGLCSTLIYRTWKSMKERCLIKTNKNWKHYGGRGIRICEFVLESPANLLAVIGDRPSADLSIDRKDNDGHYSCGECSECLKKGWTMNIRWATAIQQHRNRSSNRFISVNGISKTVAEWAETFHGERSTLYKRADRGEIGRAFLAPLHERSKYQLKTLIT